MGLSGFPRIPGERKQPRARCREPSFLLSQRSLSVTGLSFSLSHPLCFHSRSPFLFGALQHLLCPTPIRIQMSFVLLLLLLLFVFKQCRDSYLLLPLVLVCILVGGIILIAPCPPVSPLLSCIHPWLIPRGP